MAELHGYGGALEGRRRIRFAFLATLASMLLGVLLARLVMGWLDPAAPDDNLPRWGILAGEAFILVPLIVILWQRGLPLAITLRLRSVSRATLRSAALLAGGAAILIDELDRLVALVFPMPEGLTQGMDFLAFSTPTGMVLILLGAVLIAPLAEEALFRGFFQGQLERGYGDPTKAVLLTAALFMALHFNPWWSLQIYILGVLLGYLAWRTGSIWPPVVVHGANNLLAVGFANLEPERLSWYVWGGHVSPLWLAAAVVAVYQGFRQFLAANPVPLAANPHQEPRDG